MTAPALKPHRRYPVLSIDTRLARAAAEEEGRDFDLAHVLEELSAVEPGKVLRVRIWVFDSSEAAGTPDPDPLLLLFLESPRGAGRLGSTLATRLNRRWGDGCRYEGSEQPSGEEELRWERDAEGVRAVAEAPPPVSDPS